MINQRCNKQLHECTTCIILITPDLLKVKKSFTLILVVFLVFATNFCVAQQSEEVVIRNIENAEREAVLRGDTTLLLKLLSPQVVVHNPENTIVTFKQITQRIKSGKIDYSSSERIIEKISFVENIAIVMGKEIVTPKGVTTNAGKTVTRSFTNIWMKDKNSWRLAARQATIISVL